MADNKKILELSGNIRYNLVRLIAEGGMGAVYEAQQHGTDEFVKSVAVKLIKEEFSAIPEFRSNFIGEAKLVADLIHTNIVQTYHLGQNNLMYYMVMEYVNGINLEDFFIRHLELKQKIPIDLAVFLISRVCRGLSYAHQKCDKEGNSLHIVHRDVSPRNIMLSFEGDVKVTDFGIAKAKDLMYNKEGEVIAGKDEYLSPEQAKKQVTDHRADLFSCGILLSELILSYNIFEGDTPEDTHQNIIKEKIDDFRPLDSRIDDKLNKILIKTQAKSRTERYQSGQELLVELEKYLYSDGYGPTNEKLAIYLKDLFGGKDVNRAMQEWKSANNKRTRFTQLQ